MKGKQEELFPEHALRDGRPEQENQPELKYSLCLTKGGHAEFYTEMFLGNDGGNCW